MGVSRFAPKSGQFRIKAFNQMPDAHPQFSLVSLSHHTAPLDLREKLALDTNGMERLRSELAKAGLGEFLLLSTCNRLEIYTPGCVQVCREVLHRELGTLLPLEAVPDPDALFRSYSGQEALLHLFRICSGLDSQIIGETEIFGQVKQAYEQTSKTNALGSMMNRAFQKAFQAAKWVRANTHISEGQVSIGNVAVELALRIFSDLRDCKVLVVGSGEVGQSLLKALRGRGAQQITVSSRRLERAEALAKEFGATSLAFEEWPDKLGAFSIAIFSTAAPGAVLSREQLQAALRKRHGDPLFLIDVAMPRDVAPDCAELPGVFLYNLDDLSAIANENLSIRMADKERGERYLQTKADHIWQDILRRYA